MCVRQARCQGLPVCLVAPPPLRRPTIAARLPCAFASLEYAVMDVVIAPLLGLIVKAIDIYMWVLVISVILNWLAAFNVINMSNQFIYRVGDFLHRVTDPALRRLRAFIPDLGGVDVSPVVLILVLFTVQELLIRLIFKFV
jgi:YggT family protein